MIKRFSWFLLFALSTAHGQTPFFKVTRILPQVATVRSLCFTTSQELLVGTDARTASLWNLKTSVAQQSFTGFTDAISGVACSQPSMAMGGFDGTVVYQGADRTSFKWEAGAGVTSLKLSKDGLFLYISTSSGEIVKLNTRLKQVVLRWNTGKNLNVLTLNRDETLLAAGSMEGDVWVYPTNQTTVVSNTRFETPVFALAFSPSISSLAVGLEGKGLQAYNWKTGSKTTLDATLGDVMAAEYSPGGRLLAYSRDNTVLVRSTTGETQEVSLNVQWVRSLGFGPDGKTLAAGTSENVTVLEGPAGSFEQATAGSPTPPADTGLRSGTQAIPELKESPQLISEAQRTLLNLDGEPALPLRVIRTLTNLDVLGDSKRLVLANTTARVDLLVDQAGEYPAVTRKGQEQYVALRALTELGYTVTLKGEILTLGYGASFITLKKSTGQLFTLPTVLKKSAPWQKAVADSVLVDGKPAFPVSDLIALVPSLSFDGGTQKLNFRGKYLAKPYQGAKGVAKGLLVVEGRAYLPLESLKALGITAKLEGKRLSITTDQQPFALMVDVPDNLRIVNYQKTRQLYLAEQKRIEQARIAEQKRQKAEEARIQKKIDVLRKDYPEVPNWVNLDGSFFGAAYFDDKQRLTYHIEFVNDKFKRVYGKGCFNFGRDPLYGAQIVAVNPASGGMVLVILYQGVLTNLKVTWQEGILCNFGVVG